MLKDLGWLKRVKLIDTTDTPINPATNEKLNELKTLLEAIDGHVDGLELTAENVNLNTDTLEAKIQSVRDQLDVLLSTRASEATLAQIKDYVDTIETKLQSLLDGVGKVKIWDGTNIGAFTSDGRLKISQEPPIAPPGKTELKITEYSIVAAKSYTDSAYVIPVGQTVTIQVFSVGAGEGSEGSRAELWYDPTGDMASPEIIDIIFVNGTSDSHAINFTVVGDGTKRIVMRRERFDNPSVWIFGRWEGYY